MKLSKKCLITAAILATTSLSPMQVLAAPGDTFVFQFEGGGAIATGSFTMNATYNTTEALSGAFNIFGIAEFNAINMNIVGANAGNGTFSFPDFNLVAFAATGALDFTTNLAGQGNLQDLNFAGPAPAPSGTNFFTLTANGGTGTNMLLTCFYLQGAGVCGSAPAVAVTLASLSSSLAGSAAGVDASVANVNMLINGAHSRPLARRVAESKSTAWIAGDWGRDDHGSRSGSTGLAEIGAGYNFGPAQVNVSLGKTWANQHLTNNGDLDADGQYIMVESIIPVSESHGLFATLGVHGHWGEADIRRGYFNGTTQDASKASPDTHTWGMRARLDWENVFAIQSANFSPYVDYSYTKSRMDGYTEVGGGLPARFNSRSNHASELRTGLNAVMPISGTQLNIVANAEVAHRFNDEGATSSGQVIGLFAFNLPGQDYQSTWLKAGAGVEGVVGQGQASLMLNATTQSFMPNAWLAASYQMQF